MIKAPIDVVFGWVDNGEKSKDMDTMFVENIYEFEEDGKSGKPGTKFKSVQIIENKKYTNECTDN